MGLKAYSGTGTIYLAPITAAGVKTAGYRRVGTAYPMSVQVSTEQIKVKSREVESAGTVVAAKNEVTDYAGSLTLHEWNAANLAWALAGTATDQTASGGTVSSAESVTALPAGEYAELAHRNVSSVVVKDVTDATTYVAGTDYTLDARLGLITIIDGGSITATDVLHVTYSYAAKTGYQVAIGTQAQIRVAILAHLYNEYSGEHYEMELDSVVLAANQEINFISEQGSEGEKLQFTLTPEKLDGATSPGRVNGVAM